MKIPKSINEFNKLTPTEKWSFVDFETSGYHYPAHGGILVYIHYDLIIEYKRDKLGKLNTITATTIKGASPAAQRVLASTTFEESRRSSVDQENL